MIFQEPMSSLNPCFTVGFQIAESLKLHLGLGRASAASAPIELLHAVGISDSRAAPRGVFPHQLSGGMNQRVMIAMALSCNPKLLIADEPTTALDVTIQAQILDLLLSLQHETGMALVLITHDMGVVAETAERVAVFYAGQKVEEQPVSGAVRRSASSLYRGAAGRAAGTRGRPQAAVDRPASCPASSTARKAACFRRAAASPHDRFADRHRAKRQGARLRLRALPLPARRRPPARPGPTSAERRAGMNGTAEPDTVLEARNLARHYAISRGPLSPEPVRQGASTASASRSRRARPWRSSANPAAASRRSPASSAMIEPPTPGELLIDGDRRRRARTAATLQALRRRSRSYFRTPTARSTRARRSARYWRSRWSLNRPTCSAADATRSGARDACDRVGLRPRALRPLSAHVLRRPAPARSPSPGR